MKNPVRSLSAIMLLLVLAASLACNVSGFGGTAPTATPLRPPETLIPPTEPPPPTVDVPTLALLFGLLVKPTEIAASSFRGRTPRDDGKKNSDSRPCSKRQRGIPLLAITTAANVTNVLDEHTSLIYSRR